MKNNNRMTDADKLVRYMTRKKLAAAYAEIAALTPGELDEILNDPALNATYKQHCDYWRHAQAVFDRYDVDPWNTTKRLLSMKV